LEKVRQPYYEVTYNAVDITEEISEDVIKISYEDAAAGESNECRILLDDMSGKWKNEWLSNVGAKINLKIGYSNDNLLDCGEFEIDEIHYKGQPDMVELRCLSIGESNSWREPDSKIFTNQTIRQIAQYMADKNQVTLRETVEYTADQLMLQWEKRVLSMTIERVVQDRETDIGFLNRICKKWGISFVLTPSALQVYCDVSYESYAPVLNAKIYYSNDSFDEREGIVIINGEVVEVIDGIELKSYDIKNCSEKTISSVEVRYHDPFTNELYQYEVDYDSLPPGGKINPLQQDMNSFLRKEKEYVKVENKQQAEIAAAASLYRKISEQMEGDMNMEGAPTVVAGVAMEVVGIGKLSGIWYVSKTYHTITRKAGYTTRAEVKFLSAYTTS
jgi:phage protein D